MDFYGGFGAIQQKIYDNLRLFAEKPERYKELLGTLPEKEILENETPYRTLTKREIELSTSMRSLPKRDNATPEEEKYWSMLSSQCKMAPQRKSKSPKFPYQLLIEEVAVDRFKVEADKRRAQENN